MVQGTQAPKKHERLRLLLRRRLDERRMRFTDLAATIGHDISVVSKAVNHGRYPRVLAKAKGVLGVR